MVVTFCGTASQVTILKYWLEITEYDILPQT